MDIPTIIGLLAAAGTTFSFLPQAIKTIRSKQTKDLSLGMYAILAIGILLWLIYGLLLQNLPIILANGVTIVFVLVILVLKIKGG
ncbi:MAG TPA: SemiSWEET transporter [Candidatus Nanoarchaeia archaeon]|nr:SemiSWEET transporter [Candidatus Nanoarchaeia archaeon]